MGNLVSCRSSLRQYAASKNVVKLVHCNGVVDEFYRPVRVGELTLRYPHHFICNSNHLSLMCSGCGVPPSLSEDDKMELGHTYSLLPRQVLDSPLTQADIAGLISKAAMARKASCKGSQLSLVKHLSPLPPQSWPTADDVRIQLHENSPSSPHVQVVSREFVQQVLDETRLQLQQSSISKLTLSKQLCTDLELQTTLTKHILAKSCARLWRPPLQTIEESNRPHELTEFGRISG